MEFLFETFREASRYTAHIAKVYKSSPLLTRRGGAFAVVLPDGLKSKLGQEGLTVAAVFACLIADKALADTPQTQLVIEALRRSNSALESMSEAELGEYLRSLSPDQLQGLANNVKGIYHELSFVELHNLSGSDTVANVFEGTNHVGADVYFTNGEHVIGHVQLKATDSVAYVRDHTTAHPDINVLATDEVAARMKGVESSGFSNSELTAEVSDALNSVMNPSLLDHAGDALASIAGGIFELLTW